MENWNAPGLKRVVRFLEDDEQMTMIRDENGVDLASICKQSECQINPRQNWLLGCLSEQLLKNLKVKTDALGYCLTVLYPRGQVDRRYGQTVWSSFQGPIMFPGGGGGGCKQKSGRNLKG